MLRTFWMLVLGWSLVLPVAQAADQEQNDRVRFDEVFTESGPELTPASYASTGPYGSVIPQSQCWSPLDSLELFVGLDGSKQPQDFGVNAQFGGRVHVNWGAPIVEDWGLGVQIGTGGNFSDHAVRVTSQIDGAGSRSQSFTTVGIFQRTPDGVFSWAVAYDMLAERDYDNFFLTQFRGQAGVALTDFDEVGVFGMTPQEGDDGEWANVPMHLRALRQGSFYWRHTFDHNAEVGFWLGAADGHGRNNVALGDAKSTGTVLVFGSDVHIPLTDCWALFGRANFVTPADTGTVDAFLGFAYYPGATAQGWRKRAYSPVLPVANNPSFTVDLRR